MGQREKTAMRAMIGRSSDVVDGEITLLNAWANNAVLSAAKRARCLKRKQRITQGARARMNVIVRRAGSVSAANVHSGPNSVHNSMVAANERSLSGRQRWNLAQITDKAFTRGLRRAEANSNDSVVDAQIVFDDCT